MTATCELVLREGIGGGLDWKIPKAGRERV